MKQLLATMACVAAIAGCAFLRARDPAQPEVRFRECPAGARWVVGEDDLFMGCLTPEGVAHGGVLTYYETGSRHGYAEYDMGALNGRFFLWHENGQPEASGWMTGGCPSGVWSWWFESGSLRKTTEFAVDGVPHGEHREYFEDGQLKREGRWDRGVPAGEWRAWDKSGARVRRAIRQARDASDRSACD